MSDNGNFYYCIKTRLSENGEIYAFADQVNIDDGALILRRTDGLITLSISKGNWSSFYAASVIDGACVSVEHWKGEYIPDSQNE